MDYKGLVNAICDDGETEVSRTYTRPEQQEKREGCLRGFQEARMTVGAADLKALLDTAIHDREAARLHDSPHYWFWRCREAQIEWVTNVVSAALMTIQQPVIIQPTARGLMKAADILGVRT